MKGGKVFEGIDSLVSRDGHEIAYCQFWMGAKEAEKGGRRCDTKIRHIEGNFAAHLEVPMVLEGNTGGVVDLAGDA